MVQIDPFAGQTYDPILTTLPDTLKAFANKYSDPDVQGYVNTLPPSIRNPLIDMDRKRVLRGQQPFSKKQLAQAAQTSLDQTAYTKPPGKKATNVFGNFLSDLGAITTSIPRIPSALIKEVKDLEQLPTQLNAAKGPADYFKLPGVRLVPGAYTAGNVLGGRKGIQEALTHPLFTTLDVLPAAKATGLTEAVAESRVGALAREAKAAVAKTRPGQYIAEAVGPRARQVAHAQEIASARVREILNPTSKALTDADIAGDPLAVAARSAAALDKEFPSINPERRRELTQQMQLDRNLITDDVERAYIDRYEDILKEYEKIGIAQGEFANINGEVYDKQTARRLLKAKENRDAYERVWVGGGKGSQKVLAQLDRTYNRLQAQAVPARFRPQVQARLADRIKLTYGTPENIAQVTQAIAEKNYRAIPGWDQQEFNRWTGEVERTWQQMRESGIDPVFVHHVDPSAVASIKYPRVLEKAKSLSQARARTNDATPYVQDATVALTHQGLEWLSRRGSEDFAETIRNSFGRSYDDIAEELRPAARRRAARDPSKDVAGHLQDLIQKEWIKFNPSEFIPWKSPKVTALAKDEILIPKTIYRNVRRMHDPVTNGLTAAIDPVMNVFRTSVLPLSPRWHLNNIFGGSISTGVEAPGSFRFMDKAQEIVRTGETTFEGQKLRLPEELRLSLGGSSRVHQEFSYRAGGTFHRLLGEANAARAEGLINPIRQGFNNVVQKSFDANAFMDDVYRAASYLEGYSKKIGKEGRVLSTAEREAAGMALSKKVLQTWTDLTPIERSVMRYVFPFYGFMQHITRFALRYPMDHPFRASVMGALARTELDDLGTTLPEKFLNNFFLGKPDENGNVKSIQFGGMNPFRDVSNYFTFAGLLGQTNPIAATIAQQLGLDTQTGAPELYPNLRFDAETGRLAVKSENPLQALVENTLPQSRVLLGLAQSGSEFKELMSRDPDAAARLMRSQLGLPVIFRNVNRTQEEAKAEFARMEGQQGALREALRSGSDREARRYENLRPLLDQIRTLQGEGALEQFTPTTTVPSALHMAQQAIIRQNAP